MFAMIDRFPIGLFTWTAIGIALGYCVALFARTNGRVLMVPTLLGLVGGLLGGAGAGLAMTGHGLWETNVAALVGAGVLAVGWKLLAAPRPAGPG